MIDFIKRYLLAPCMPMYFGGKSSSSASTATSTTTTTNTNQIDQSMMGGDDAVGLNGNQNIVDKSVVNNTAFTDNSNRSNTTTFTDTSNRSNTISTSNSSTTNNYATDYGSVGKALDGMGQLSTATVNTASDIVKNGIKGLSEQSKDNIAVIQAAFDFAGKSSAADAVKYTDALGLAKDTISKANDAFATAKDGGQNKTLLIAAVATVGAVGLAFALKD
jgi:hypothetical protein